MPGQISGANTLGFISFSCHFLSMRHRQNGAYQLG
jgi:hypothetical protein